MDIAFVPATRAGKGHAGPAGKFQDFAGAGKAVSKHLQGTQAYY